jgi:hypothetical protein
MKTAGEKLLERIAVAVEALAIDPEVEINAGPPICPSCGAFDPMLTLAFQEGGTGKMSELIIDGNCQCKANVYIVIESYSVHKSSETAIAELKEREKAGFFKP